MSAIERIDRTETWAIQHSRSPTPGEADRAKDILAICRIARAGVALDAKLADFADEHDELSSSVSAAS